MSLSREKLQPRVFYGAIDVIPLGGVPTRVVEAGKNSLNDPFATEYPYLKPTDVILPDKTILRISVEGHHEARKDALVHYQIFSPFMTPWSEQKMKILDEGKEESGSNFVIIHKIGAAV